MSETLIVGGVETFSIVDYPEHAAAVVFLQGCPWRCPFCYNTDLQTIGQSTTFLWEKFMDFLRKRQGILDAVVFSGGEPLVQNALPEAMAEVKALGYKIGLHTGGYRPEQLARALPLIDWIGFDIKAPLNAERYQQVTKTNHFNQVMTSLEMVLVSGLPFECRTTCDPRLLNCEDIRVIAAELKTLGVKNYFLQKYRPIPSDTVTAEDDCDRPFADEQLLAQLKTDFEQFEVRR